MGRNIILLKDAVEEYKSYKKRQMYYVQDIEQMNIFFDMLLSDVESGRAYDLTKKTDKEELREHAKALVKLPKKDSGLLKASDVQRAKFFNGFVDYVTDASVFKKGKVRLEKIPFVMNELERKIDIVKNYRQLESLTQEEIGDIYYVGDKTIRNDLREIKDGCLNAFGQKIDIGYDYEKKELFSTPVPLFLVQNITQIITLLNGLKVQYEDPRYSCYAEATAINIWRQLAGPVRERILNELVDMLHLDEGWYMFLEMEKERFKESYYHERKISQNEGNAMMFLKNALPCTVVYFEDDKTKSCENTRIVNCMETYFEVEDGTQIPYDKVLGIIETGN